VAIHVKIRFLTEVEVSPEKCIEYIISLSGSPYAQSYTVWEARASAYERIGKYKEALSIYQDLQCAYQTQRFLEKEIILLLAI
jgi:hypothetical protein